MSDLELFGYGEGSFSKRDSLGRSSSSKILETQEPSNVPSGPTEFEKLQAGVLKDTGLFTDDMVSELQGNQRQLTAKLGRINRNMRLAKEDFESVQSFWKPIATGATIGEKITKGIAEGAVLSPIRGISKLIVGGVESIADVAGFDHVFGLEGVQASAHELKKRLDYIRLESAQAALETVGKAIVEPGSVGSDPFASIEQRIQENKANTDRYVAGSTALRVGASVSEMAGHTVGFMVGMPAKIIGGVTKMFTPVGDMAVGAAAIKLAERVGMSTDEIATAAAGGKLFAELSTKLSGTAKVTAALLKATQKYGPTALGFGVEGVVATEGDSLDRLKAGGVAALFAPAYVMLGHWSERLRTGQVAGTKTVVNWLNGQEPWGPRVAAFAAGAFEGLGFSMLDIEFYKDAWKGMYQGDPAALESWLVKMAGSAVGMGAFKGIMPSAQGPYNREHAGEMKLPTALVDQFSKSKVSPDVKYDIEGPNLTDTVSHLQSLGWNPIGQQKDGAWEFSFPGFPGKFRVGTRDGEPFVVMDKELGHGKEEKGQEGLLALERLVLDTAMSNVQARDVFPVKDFGEPDPSGVYSVGGRRLALRFGRVYVQEGEGEPWLADPRLPPDSIRDWSKGVGGTDPEIGMRLKELSQKVTHLNAHTDESVRDAVDAIHRVVATLGGMTHGELATNATMRNALELITNPNFKHVLAEEITPEIAKTAARWLTATAAGASSPKYSILKILEKRKLPDEDTPEEVVERPAPGSSDQGGVLGSPERGAPSREGEVARSERGETDQRGAGQGEGELGSPSGVSNQLTIANRPGDLKGRKAARRSEIKKAMEEATGDLIKSGRGWFKQKKALGWFSPSGHQIRTAGDLDASTLAHEFGHAMDKKLTGLDATRFPQDVRAELDALGRALYGTQVPAVGHYFQEGVAEWVARYLWSDPALQRLAPRTSDYMLNTLIPTDAKFAKQFAAIKKMFDTRTGGTAYQLMRSELHLVTDPSSEKSKSIWRRFNEAFIDDSDALIHLVEDLFIKNGIAPHEARKLAASDNPIKMLEALRGSAPQTAMDFVMNEAVDVHGRRIGPSLASALKQIEWKDYAQFSVYLLSRRLAEVYHERGLESGVERGRPEFVVQELDAAYPHFREVSDQIHEWNSHLLDYLQSSGGLSTEMRDKIDELNPFYVHLARLMNENQYLKAEAGLGLGKAFVNRGTSLKSLTGGGQEFDDIIKGAVAQAMTMINRANRMRVANGIIDFAERTTGIGDGERFEWGQHLAWRVQPNTEAVKIKVEAAIEQLEGMGIKVDTSGVKDPSKLAEAMITTFFTNENAPRDNSTIATVIRDGKPVLYEFHPDVFRYLTGMDSEQLGFWSKIAMPFTRAVRLGAVSTNPTFGLIVNPIIDALTYPMYSEAGFTFPGYSMIKGAFKDIFPKVFPGAVSGGVAKRAEALGTMLATHFGQNKAHDAAQIKGMFKQSKGEKVVDLLTSPKSLLMKPIQALEFIVGRPERWLRIEEFDRVYKQAKKNDFSESDAILEGLWASKEIMNYTRAGYYGRVLNTMIPFWNAAVQGSRKFWRVFSGVEGTDKQARAFIYAMSAITAPTIAFWLLNKDDERYRRLDRKDRDEHWFIYYSKDHPPIRIPKPREAGYVFSAGVERVLDYMHDKEPRGASEYAYNLVSQLIPFTDVSRMLPVFLKLPFEAISNFDTYRMKNVVSSYAMDSKEPWDRSTVYTTEFSKMLGGMLNVSPAMIDHTLKNATGSMGLEVVRDLEWITGGKWRRSEGLAGAPVVGTLFGREDLSNTQITEDFFEIWKELKQSHGSNTLKGKMEFAWMEASRLKGEIDDIRKRRDASQVDKQQANLQIEGLAKRGIATWKAAKQ